MKQDYIMRFEDGTPFYPFGSPEQKEFAGMLARAHGRPAKQRAILEGAYLKHTSWFHIKDLEDLTLTFEHFRKNYNKETYITLFCRQVFYNLMFNATVEGMIRSRRKV